MGPWHRQLEKEGEVARLKVPRWLKYREGENERSPVYFLDIRGQGLDLDDGAVRDRINRSLKEMLHALDIRRVEGPAVVKCHIGEAKCDTRMVPEFALSTVDFLRDKGVTRVVAGDTTTVYSGPRGHRQNPPADASKYMELARAHGWHHGEGLGLPFVVLDRPATSVPGVFEFDEEEVVVSRVGKYREVYVAGGIAAAPTIVSHSHLTLHQLTHFAMAVKTLTMGGGSVRGKLLLHKLLQPRIDEEACTRCGKCAKNCPEQALVWAKGDVPTLIVERCIGCGECASICKLQADCIEIVTIRTDDWVWGEAAIPYRLVDFLMAEMNGRWNGLINVAHLYRITQLCDCVDVVQRPIVSDIGFLVGRNPFAVDYLARELFNAQVQADRGEGARSGEPANMVATFYGGDEGMASFTYARATYGVVVEPQVERVALAP